MGSRQPHYLLNTGNPSLACLVASLRLPQNIHVLAWLDLASQPSKAVICITITMGPPTINLLAINST